MRAALDLMRALRLRETERQRPSGPATAAQLDRVPCEECQHSGWIVETNVAGDYTRKHRCPSCDGSGWRVR
jgi:hypothetical protein